MKRQVIILIFIWSGLLSVWAVANPPSGTVGATLGGLFGDSIGNIGIKTAVPTTALDINGTTTIRKSLDMANNRIVNLTAPATSTDAVNKAYIDAQTANMASSTGSLWGEGRPNTTVINALGECTSTLSAAIKVSRSSITASWDGARAACPANWWVCSAAERGTNACGTATTRPTIYCDPANAGNNELIAYNAGGGDILRDWGWVNNTANTDDRKALIARTISGANTAEQYACSILPVWCCAYQ